MSKIDKAVTWMINLANNPTHGYDQQYRWGERGDYDCSSAVITAWQNAGVPVKSYGAGYTGNMYNAFLKAGFKDVTRSVNLKTGSGLIRGDVLLNTTHHTALYIGNGQLAQASINEKGTVRGGKPGDQTGREINISRYYNFPWNVILRYPEAVSTPKPAQPAKKSNEAIAQEVIAGKWGNNPDRARRLKAAGYDPVAIQNIVNSKYSKKLTTKYVTVQKGDTLTGIARRNGTTVDRIVQLNGIKNRNLIFPGEKLRVK